MKFGHVHKFDNYRFWFMNNSFLKQTPISYGFEGLLTLLNARSLKTSKGLTDSRQSWYLEWCHDVPFPQPKKNTLLSTKNAHGKFSQFPGHDSRCVAYTKAACSKLETDGNTSTVWKTKRRNQKCWRTKSDLDSPEDFGAKPHFFLLKSRVAWLFVQWPWVFLIPKQIQTEWNIGQLRFLTLEAILDPKMPIHYL